MKTLQLKILAVKDEEMVTTLLNDLVQKGVIEFSAVSDYQLNKSTPVSEDQAQEIIEESEIGPYYSEQDAKNILNI